MPQDPARFKGRPRGKSRGGVEFAGPSNLGAQALSSEFILPSKQSKPLVIRPPPATNDENGFPTSTERKDDTINSPEDGKTEDSITDVSSTIATPPAPRSTELSRKPLVCNFPAVIANIADKAPEENGSDKRGQSTNLTSGDDSSDVASTQRPSDLDVYAPNYVPLWLKAVNESYAVLQYCQTLSSINFPTYINSYAGNRLRPPCSSPPPPPISELIQPSDLNERSYDRYWFDRLRNESAAYSQELTAYSLYNILIGVENNQTSLYHITVPGLRENAPRIDLGDAVLVRPLIQFVPNNIGQQATLWYEQGGPSSGRPAPNFVGTEYTAIVWGVLRARERVILRIDTFPPFHVNVNVRYVLQDHKRTPLLRSIHRIGSELESSRAETSYRTWVTSMLFPDHVDSVMQTSLWKGTFDLNCYDQVLNFEQARAVDAVVANHYGAVPYLISGPPGTGKTKTIVETALQLLANPGSVKPHLLLCAPSDPAADTLATRLAAHLTPKQMFRLNSWTRSFAEVRAEILPYTYVESDLFSLPSWDVMMSFQVVVTTCRDADLLVQALLTNQALSHLALETITAIAPSAASAATSFLHWTALLVDEAAQATEPEVLVPIEVVMPPGNDSLGLPQIIMAGDQFQLGPRLSDRTGGLQVSLLERLFDRPFYAGHPMSRRNVARSLKADMLPMPRAAFTNLIRNYRSHPAILATPSALYYHDTLIPEFDKKSDLSDWPAWQPPYHWPVLFVQNDSVDAVDSVLTGTGTGTGSGLVYNEGEAALALQHAQSLLAHFSRTLQAKDVMVMSPFRAQVTVLRQRFRDAGLSDVNIGPLEAFQGLEARVVIICTTRTRLGAAAGREDKFVRDDQTRGLGVVDESRRFNVAMTRAKEALVVIGSAPCLTCTGDGNWAAFLSFCQRNGCVRDTAGRLVVIKQSGPESVSRLERALRYAHDGLGRGGGGQPLSQPLRGRSVFALKGIQAEMDEWLSAMVEPSEDADEEGETGKDGVESKYWP